MGNDDLFEKVEPSRREFLKRLLEGAAFTTPMLVSFSMDGLTLGRPAGAADPSGPRGTPLKGGADKTPTGRPLVPNTAGPKPPQVPNVTKPIPSKQPNTTAGPKPTVLPNTLIQEGPKGSGGPTGPRRP